LEKQLYCGKTNLEFVVKKLSYGLSDTQGAEVVECLLRGIGELDLFECRSNKKNDNRIRAVAFFMDSETAIRAASELNDIKVPELGKSR